MMSLEVLRNEAKKKIQTEENILKTFKNEKEMVKLSLKRILDIPDVDTEVLFETDISNILYSVNRGKIVSEDIKKIPAVMPDGSKAEK